LNKKIQLLTENHDQQLDSIIAVGDKVVQVGLRDLEIKPDYFFDYSQTIQSDYSRISQQPIQQSEVYNLDQLIPTVNIPKNEQKEQVIKLQPYMEWSARLPDSLNAEKAKKSGQNIEQNIQRKLEERAYKFIDAVTLLKKRMDSIETALMNENSYLNDQHIALKQKVAEYQENSSNWMKEYEGNVWQIFNSGQPQEQQQLQYQQVLYKRLQEINKKQTTAINLLLDESLLQLELSKQPDQLNLESLLRTQSIINARSKLEEQEELQELREEIEIRLNNIVKLQHSENLQGFLIELKQSQNKLLETESSIKSWDDDIIELRTNIAKNIDLANKAKSEEQLQYLQSVHKLQKDLYKSEQIQEDNLLNYWHQLQLLQSGIQLLQQDAQLVQLESIPELPDRLKEIYKTYEIKYHEIIAHDKDIVEQMVNWKQLEARQEKLYLLQVEIDEQQKYLDSQGLSPLIEEREGEKKGEEDTSITLSLDPENMKKMEQWQQQKASFDRSIEPVHSQLSNTNIVAENLVMSELDKEDADIVKRVKELHLATEPQFHDSAQPDEHIIAFSTIEPDDNSVKGKIAKFEAISSAGALAAGKAIINVTTSEPKMKTKKVQKAKKTKMPY